MTTAMGGLRVVDFSRFLPGAYVGWVAGDMGAEVVRIEHPRELAKHAAMIGHDADPAAAARRRARPSYTRNKRSLLVDPGHPDAKPVLHRLIAEADILIEDYRPGVLERMGYGYAEMAAINPRLIYCSISFAGSTGPYAGRAGHDPAALALAGALSRLNGLPVPTMPGLQVADVLTGCHATIGTLVALEARHRTERGQHVEVAMSDASMALLLVTMGRVDDAAALPQPDGAWHPKGGVWECADGAYLCTTDMEPRYWQRFCEAVGRPEFIGWQHDTSRHPEMHAALTDMFRTRSRDAWFELLSAADTQVMPVLSVAEALDHPHNRARGMVIDVGIGEGSVRQLGTPFHLSDTPGQVRYSAGAPGAESADILAELGLSETEIAALRVSGAFPERVA